MADAPALGAGAAQAACRFDPDLAHQPRAARARGEPAIRAGRPGRPLYFPGHACDHDPLREEHPRRRGGAPRRSRRARRRRRHPPPEPAHPRRRVPPRQGPSRHARACPGRGRRLGRGRRDARRDQLPRMGEGHGRRPGHLHHRPPRGRGGRGRGGQAAPLQGHGAASPRGEARRLRQLPVQARDRRRSTTPRSIASWTSCATSRRRSARSRSAPAAKGDWAVIGFVGTRDGVPFDGGTSERMPLVIGEERLIPGFEEHLVGLRPGRARPSSTSRSPTTTRRSRSAAPRPTSAWS